MNWLRSHWQACKLALTRLAASPLNTLLSMLGIGIALALPAGHQCFGAMMVGYPQHRYHRLPTRKTPNITWRMG